MRTLHTLVIAVALCGAPLLQAATAATPSRCDPLAPALTRTLKPGALLLLGEVHGTAQAPAVAERVVCAALQRGRSLTLFLEIPADEQPRLDAYQRSDGGVAAQRSLVRGSPFWDAPMEWQDGRRSAAMLALVDTVRRLREQGMTLDLIAFDALWGGSADRDRTMADRVRAERARDPARVLITYTGNVHNMLELPRDMPPGLPPPMGTYLADLRPVSIDLRTDAGGAAWNCASQCGANPMQPMPAPRQRERRERPERAYTDAVPLGPVTPSIPAAFRLDARAAL